MFKLPVLLLFTAQYLLLGATMAFTPPISTTTKVSLLQSSTTTTTTTQLHMGGARGGATSPTGKQTTISTVKTLLDTSEMIFTIPASAITVKQSQNLRRSMPEGTSVKVIKNKLMARALQDTPFDEAAKTMLKGANMWFFIEQDISGTLKAYNVFLKEANKRETHQVLGGVLEGQAYDGEGVDTIGKLPSKLELYAKIAGAIKAVPTKVARVVKEPTSKLARAIKLATDQNNE